MRARVITTVVVLSALVWAAWAYGSLWSFGRAVDANDAARLGAHVDWDSVRDHLKGDVKRRLSVEIGGRKGEQDSSEDVARGALMLLGSVVAEGLINAYATPDGLLAVLREIAHSKDRQGRFFDTVSYAFFSAPTTFRVHLKPPGSEKDDGKPLVLIFTFKDFGWVLTRMKLPLDELEDHPAARDEKP